MFTFCTDNCDDDNFSCILENQVLNEKIPGKLKLVCWKCIDMRCDILQSCYDIFAHSDARICYSYVTVMYERMT